METSSWDKAGGDLHTERQQAPIKTEKEAEVTKK